MGKPAAVMGDNVLQDGPHCHAPIHPPAPSPTPLPHPPMPLPITLNTSPTVMIGNKPAATVGSMTNPCILPSCVPGGPGQITMGSMTVLINNKPAARLTSMTAHSACVGPIPGPTGKVIGPGVPTVLIGG